MTTAAEMLRRLSRVNLTEIASEVIAGNPKPVADLNREQLYQDGLKADGTKLKKYRSDAYARRKNARNPGPGLGNPDFFNTGDFQRALFVDARTTTVVFSSSDPKTPLLLQRDGPEIFGLTDESKAEYRPTLMAGIAKEVKRETGCK